MKQVIIIGGGNSVNSGLCQGLVDKLRGKWTIGLNYAFQFIPTTCLAFMDRQFFIENKAKLNSVPIFICKYYNHQDYFENGIYLRSTEGDYKSLMTTDIYHGCLSGFMTLSMLATLGLKLEVFLLGFDFGEYQGRTHFYDAKHGGHGSLMPYKDIKADNFDYFKLYPNLKIINVSPESKINSFEKIDYPEFFGSLRDCETNVEKLKKMLKFKLKTYIVQ